MRYSAACLVRLHITAHMFVRKASWHEIVLACQLQLLVVRLAIGG